MHQHPHARPRRIAPALFAIALALSMAGGETAEAQRGGAVNLVELELSQGRGRGQLALHYTLGRRARPDVRLHISLDRARRGQDLVTTLDHQQGWIPLGRARGSATVTVRATDRAGRTIPMRLGRGLLVSAVELTADLVVERAVIERQWGGGPPRRGGVRVDGPRGPGGPPPGSTLGALDAACRSAFVGQDAEAECLRILQRQGGGERIVQACDQAFVGEDATLRCLRARPRPRAVAACDSAFVGEDATLRCLRSNPQPRAVAACDRMFIGEDTTLRCVAVVGRSRANDAEVDQVFQVCGRRVGESAEMACLDDMLTRRRRGRR